MLVYQRVPLPIGSSLIHSSLNLQSKWFPLAADERTRPSRSDCYLVFGFSFPYDPLFMY